MDNLEWEKRIKSQRKGKDKFFARDPQSPIPHEDRFRFKGLRYFPPDIKYRFELKLYEHADKKIVEIQDTGGNTRKMLRWGEFRFEIEGEECKLQAYKDSPSEEQLFVPFRDKTCGKETYGAGRYIDLDPGRNKTPEGKWVLDFNEAYNPWCAYSENYVCPFVPPENWLNVEIKAGEKDYEK